MAYQYQKVNSKEQIDKEKIKKEFKKRLYDFILALLRFTERLDSRDPIVRVIRDQLIRSATSILSNYVEGQSAGSKRELVMFFGYCLKSANESKVWIALLRDTGKCKGSDAEWFLQELNEIANIFASSILTLKGKRQKIFNI